MSSTVPDGPAIAEPVLRQAEMHLCRPTDPCEGVIVRNELCTAGKKAAGVVRHLEIDISGTPLEGRCLAGQSIGVLAPGLDAHGKPHKVRLYSLASPSLGEDGAGKVISTTVKRSIDEHWETHELFIGVCSNYLCDRKVGDKVRLSGPNGKRFVLPARFDEHEYLFVATGTGIAPFRGMVTELLKSGCQSRITLLMGTPYSTDLLYHEQFLKLQKGHANFRYITSVSRERNGEHDRLYVQDRLRTDREALLPQLCSSKTLIYICGLAGMELGIFQELARQLPPEALSGYLGVSPEVLAGVNTWQRSMINKEVRPTRRVFMEVYA
ncbi:MAG: hypothetical protein K2X32_03080 [Phycisphaerales bacterium]|nr:hypothetical protein [Phycisphaerales bacterium]